MYKSIDLFAGIGGIRKGFDNAFGKKIKTVFVSEWDEFAQKTYKANFKDKFDIAGDITQIKEEDIPKFDICLAGFPCQAFSMAGKHMGFDDDYKGICRGTLFQDVVRICDYHKPKIIFCENVKGLTIHDSGRTFKVIKGAFEQIGYTVYDQILNSKDFGVPQNRERIYLVCIRNDIVKEKCPEGFTFPVGNRQDTKIRDILDPAPVPAKYYLSDVYLETLRRHRARHEAAGHGFGYEVRDLDGIAGTIVCGGMGRERNLIVDDRDHSLEPTTHIQGEINQEGIRKMTPREWARLQGFPEEFKLELADTHLYKQFGNSVTVNVIEAIAEEILKVLQRKKTSRKKSLNRGEWGEPYTALKLLGDKKLIMADENGDPSQAEWMEILKVRRKETKERIVTYFYNEDNIEIEVNDTPVNSIPSTHFRYMAELLKRNILESSGRSFVVSDEVLNFLKQAEIKHMKAKSTDKSDIYLDTKDPRGATVRNDIGFSVKCEFGKDPTLFNTAKASAAKYKLTNMNDELMRKINTMFDKKGNAAVSNRCDAIVKNGCKMEYIGYEYAKKAKCEAFKDNLDTIDPRLPEVMQHILWNHFIRKYGEVDIIPVMQRIINENPCNIKNPQIKYPYMMKTFLYSAYCGMTASTIWEGGNQNRGGYITVKSSGGVVGNYAMESDDFKNYLYNHCYFDFPSTKPDYGDYAEVYKENDEYYFKLNFQIRIR